MGLDSVELVMNYEKYFGIQIRDEEAEKIATVQDATNCIAGHLSIRDNNFRLKEQMAGRLKQALEGMNENLPEPETFIFQRYPPEAKSWWAELEKRLGLTIPQTNWNAKATKSLWSRWLWEPTYDWQLITTDHCLDVLCAAHYRRLVPVEKLASVYEVYISVVGLTAEKLGLDPYEIQPGKSFTGDLGLD